MNTTAAAAPSLAVIDELDWWALKQAAMRAAVELDIFTAIAAGHGTLEAIAAAVGASKRGTRIVLDALCPVGLLCKTQGAYTLTPTADAFLVRGKPTCIADAYLAFWRSRDRLAEAVRTGKPTLDIPGPQAEELWANLTGSELLAWPHGAETARERWAQLGITGETRRGLHILDVACGSGVGSFALAQMDPTARVTALDLPKVLAVAAQVAEQMGVRDQVTFCPGDLRTAEFPAGQFDVALFGSILYYFNRDTVMAVLRKAHQTLKGGGIVVIRTFIADEERAGRLCQSVPAS